MNRYHDASSQLNLTTGTAPALERFPIKVPIQVEQAALQIARQAPGAEAVMGANLPCLDRDTAPIPVTSGNAG